MRDPVMYQDKNAIRLDGLRKLLERPSSEADRLRINLQIKALQKEVNHDQHRS